ncbi:hypothetical protein ACLOJK_038689 [Asimina triloba]
MGRRLEGAGAGDAYRRAEGLLAGRPTGSVTVGRANCRLEADLPSDEERGKWGW